MKTYDRLILMINQIVTNFAMEDDPASATAEHIALFWDARMKTMLMGGDDVRLLPTAASALALVREAALDKAVP